MIKNYIFLPDLFTVFLTFIMIANVNTNHKIDRERIGVIITMIKWVLITSILSVIFNIINIYLNNIFIKFVFYKIFLVSMYYSILMIAKFFIKVNNFKREILIRLENILNVCFIVFVFMLIFSEHIGLLMKVDPNEPWYFSIFNLTYMYIIVNFGVVSACFFQNKYNIMHSIWSKIIYLGPFVIFLLLFDFLLRYFLESSVSWTIMPISLAVIVTNIFMIYYIQPYDRVYGTLGQDTLEFVINDAIKKKEEFYLVKIVIEDKEKIELNIGKDNYEQFLISLIIFMDNLSKDTTVYKIMDNIILQKLDGGDCDINSILFRVEEKLQSYSHIDLIYKVTLIRINDEIDGLQNYYNLDKMLTRKCDFNEIYTCQEKDYKKVQREMIIINELLSIAKGRDLNDDRIMVTLQPIYDINKHKFITAESLIRMKSDKLGIVYPDDFIYIAEELGIIHDITKIVLNKVCVYYKEIKKLNKKIDAITVNISPEEIERDNFIDDIIDIISINKVEFSAIRLEFIESLAVKNYDVIRNKMNKLIEYGITFYLDDFGSGYSNFDKLMTFPFTTIKFDKSIVWGAVKDRKKYYVLREITKIFRDSGFTVLYEGIENEEYENLAFELGVSNLQGYKYSKPVPFEEAVNFFETDEIKVLQE